ncbi:hypothetical protein V5279_33020 [Bradyrhizobium sp. 26S5]|uniref:hypothetical protein n=1 Tax=unclassified Bradyrhizobium TaxID=2631580 RepID=UPI00140C2059|nr:hypothetical protein [Bradyrhizobium sp. 2S1]MCK7672154.1 hypothetical protein [Bradyrhizobium sp. 2S1]
MMLDLRHWPVVGDRDISAAEGRKKPLSRMGKAGHPVVSAADVRRTEKLNRPLRSGARIGRMMMSGTGS